MWTKATVVSGVAAVVLVVGGAGVALAHAQFVVAPSVGTVDTPTSDALTAAMLADAGTAAQATGAAKADPALREAGRHILGKLRDFQHAEWVTQGDGNTYVTHEAILGQIQAVSSTSITVTSADGTSMTFAVNDQTKVRQRRAQGATTTPTVAEVKVGQTALVAGEKSPELTAKNILVRPS
jgi:hypothetical protein